MVQKIIFLPSLSAGEYANWSTSSNQHTTSGQLMRLQINVHQPFIVMHMITNNS
jgi:hypothetical protein